MDTGVTQADSGQADAHSISVLILAANPLGMARLRIDREVRGIEEKVRASKHGSSVRIITRWAARVDDLRHALLEVEPHVVHFSGHGTEEHEIILEDEDGSPKPIGKDALAELFGVLKDRIRVIVLSACHSATLAEAIVKHIDCAIGMKEAMPDDAAVEFAGAFYEALGFGRSVQTAFEAGVNAPKLKRIAGEDVPLLIARPGTNPAEVLPMERLPPRPPVSSAPGSAPFPGLASFDEDRADYFFGREAEIDEALAKLADSCALRWLQIDGPSGAGKSSFARAGIVPAVRAGRLAVGPEKWVTIAMRPGQDPITNLAEALVKTNEPRLHIKGRGLDDVTAALRSNVDALKLLLREGRTDERGVLYGVLLLVDQLEEAFTLAHADKTAVKQFDELLAAALGDIDGPLVLVTTIRSDFVARMGELPKLEEKLPMAARYYLQEMKEAGLRAAIEKPAERDLLSYEAGLVNRIVADAVTSRGALPLVAHVLEALYVRREGRTLTRAAYEEVGGVGGALAKSADAIVNGFDDQNRARAQKLLLRLVKIGRGSEDTVQTASREAALGAAGGGREAEEVLSRLSGGSGDTAWRGRAHTRGRLVVVRGKENSARVDLVHEALIKWWATLRGWVEEERAALELRDDVEDAARIWEASKQDDGLLPKGAALARYHPVDRAALQHVAKRYLDAADQAAQRAEEAARRVSEEAKQERERRQRRVIAGLVAVVLGLLILTSRAFLLTRELDVSKREQIRKANMNMAAMVAGSVLSQLTAFSNAVARAAMDEKLVRAMEGGDIASLQAWCASTYAFYDDPSAGLKLNGNSPFTLWLIEDEEGVAKAIYPTADVIGKSYGWRDYFKGARKLGEKGLRSTFVSPAFKSEITGYTFTISTPVYDREGRVLGVVGASVPAAASLGSLVVRDPQSHAVLVAPRGRDRDDPSPPSTHLILLHPAYAPKEAIPIDNEQVRMLDEASRAPAKRIEQPLGLPPPNLVTSSDDYEDPLGKGNSDEKKGTVKPPNKDYQGRFLAGFAPVGNTGFVVIVQTRETDAVNFERYLFRELITWTGIAAVPVTVVLLFTALRDRRRRSAPWSSYPGSA
jgi:hypothetical protein